MTDLKSSAAKAIKSRTSNSASSLTKPTKTMKKETVKQNNTQSESQPEPEKPKAVESLKQVDPKVKKMIEQIVDATQISQHDAFLALYDSEYNPNDAVNLLLEAGMKNEWSLATKKKKTRTPGEKTEKNNIEKPQGVGIPENGSFDTNTKPSIGSRGTNYRGANFRGTNYRGANFRGTNYRGANFRGTNYRGANFRDTNDRGTNFRDTNFRDTNFRGTNFRGRGRNFQDRGANFNQQSAERPFNRYNKTRTNNYSVDNRRQFDRNNEWDDQYSEYTGSLSNTLVYTCSKTTASEIPQTSVTPDEAKKTATFASVITHSSQSFEPKIKQVAPKAVLTPPEAPSNHECSPFKISTPPTEANTIKHPPMEKLSGIAYKVMTERPIVTQVSKSVEMPPSSEYSDIGSLDIQFGFLDLQDESKDMAGSEQTEIPISLKQIDNHEPLPVTMSNGNASNHFYGSASPNFSSQSALSKEPNDNNKVQETFTILPYLPSLETTSNIKTTKHSYSFAASGGASYTGISAFQEIPYYVTQPPPAMPILTNIPNSYQNVVRNQCYTVANSQSPYGSEVLPTYSCPTTQQNSTIAPFTITGSKDFESHNANLNLASRPGVPAASAMNFTPKSANVPKGHIMTNIPHAIEHQHAVQTAYVGQGGISYYQAPQPFIIQDVPILQHQQRPPNYNYDVGYPSLTRGRAPYNVISQEHSSTMHHGNQMVDVYRGQGNAYRNEGICRNSSRRPTSNQ